jgi:diguanylate cyclase (GGDEF)-like protein
MIKRSSLSRPPRILVASDQNHALSDLESFLGGHGYSVLREFAGAAVLERARAVRPDVILLDARLPDRPYLDLSRALRDDPLIGPSRPILLLATGQPTPLDHLGALRAGIWELLPRPLNPSGLLLRLDTYARARLEAERTPDDQLVDDVTGLYTAPGLARRARELLLQAFHHNAAAACVAFAPELDAAPLPADLEGAAADLVRRVAEVFETKGRHSDAIGRLGPTEFAVVAPGTDARGAVQLAERVRRAMHAAATVEASPAVELRAGYDAVANVRYTSMQPQDLLARASRALHRARVEGQWIRASGDRP